MYLFTIIFLSVFAYLEVFNKEIIEKNKAIFVFVCYAFLVFHDGFRWQTGCDWGPYSTYFDTLFVNYSVSEPEFELGYYLFLAPIRLITDNYSVYLIIHAIIFYGLIFYMIFKLSISPFVSILLLYMVTLPFLGTNRQFLAMSVYALAILALVNDKKWTFFGIVVLACFLHKSALICLVALIAIKPIKKLYLIIMLFVALAISFSGIIDKLSPLISVLLVDENSMEKFEFYSNQTYDMSIVATLFSLLKKLIWVGTLLILDSRIENKPKSYYLFFNLYFFGCLFYLIFNGTLFQVFVSRALLYFNIMEIFIVPYVLLLFKPNYGKLIVMVVLSLYVFVNIEKGISNYGDKSFVFEPYKGLFINADHVRNI